MRSEHGGTAGGAGLRACTPDRRRLVGSICRRYSCPCVGRSWASLRVQQVVRESRFHDETRKIEQGSGDFGEAAASPALAFRALPICASNSPARKKSAIEERTSSCRAAR